MRKPSDLTDEEALAEAKLLRDRRRAAGSDDAHLLLEQAFIHSATEEELRAKLSTQDVLGILAYRRSQGEELKKFVSSGERMPSLMGAVDAFVQKLSGWVNGIPQLLVARAASQPVAQDRIQMTHEGDSDLKLVVFNFSQPIQEAVLLRDDQMILHAFDLEASAPLEVWSDDVVSDTTAPVTEWRFVEGLRWEIVWKDEE